MDPEYAGVGNESHGPRVGRSRLAKRPLGGVERGTAAAPNVIVTDVDATLSITETRSDPGRRREHWGAL